ncbi:MAG TPA: hypothetical protein VFU47_14365, partial [Armatimonadota bacterium]|nr:hypothetical protein [Armatimonadota bacterium]
PAPGAAMPDPLGALIHTLTVEDPTQRCKSAAIVAETLRSMVRRALPEPEPDPEDGEMIDLSPEVLLAIPHYIARPDPRLVPAPEPTPEPPAPRPARKGRRRRPPLFFRVMGSGAVFCVAAAVAVPLLGSHRGSAREAQPAAPAAAAVKEAAAPPAAAQVKIQGTLKGWAKTWESGVWKLHAGYYQDPVERFRGGKRTRGDIARYRRMEAVQRGGVKIKALSTQVAQDGSAQVEVDTKWPRTHRQERIELRLKQVKGNWRIVSETLTPPRSSGPTVKDRPATQPSEEIRSARAL